MPIHPDGLCVLARTRNHIARGALQHRHVGGIFGERRNQRHRRSAAADDNDPLTRVIEGLGPLLWVQELALKPFDTRKFRTESSFITVITAAHIKEVANQSHYPSISCLCLDRPARLG